MAFVPVLVPVVRYILRSRTSFGRAPLLAMELSAPCKLWLGETLGLLQVSTWMLGGQASQGLPQPEVPRRASSYTVPGIGFLAPASSRNRPLRVHPGPVHRLIAQICRRESDEQPLTGSRLPIGSFKPVQSLSMDSSHKYVR